MAVTLYNGHLERDFRARGFFFAARGWRVREVIRKLREALSQVDGYRSHGGTLHNRFEGAIENLAQRQVNTASARSRIMDADYAQESVNMLQAQILQKAGSSMLGQ